MAQSVRPGVRPDVVVNETITAVVPAAVRRISWGAIIAGVVVSLVAMIAFNLLGARPVA